MGKKTWHLNGHLHREDGPAVERADGTKRWYSNGLYHREDGPAIEYSDGSKSWWLNSIHYSEQNYYKKLFELGKISEEEYFIHAI